MVTEVLGQSVSSIFKGHAVQEECHYSWTAFCTTSSFSLVVFGVGHKPVNAAMGIIAIYCENKMKHTLCESCFILQQVLYTVTTRLSVLEWYMSLFLFAII